MLREIRWGAATSLKNNVTVIKQTSSRLPFSSILDTFLHTTSLNQPSCGVVTQLYETRDFVLIAQQSCFIIFVDSENTLRRTMPPWRDLLVWLYHVIGVSPNAFYVLIKHCMEKVPELHFGLDNNWKEWMTVKFVKNIELIRNWNMSVHQTLSA